VPLDGGAGASDDAWHAQGAADVLAALETRHEGLSVGEARARKHRYGPNRLAAARKQSEILRFLAQFDNVLIYVLLAAAVLAASIGHFTDAAVVLAVVLVNATIGYVQEGRAEKALEAIRGMIDPHASVIRGGRRTVIAAEDIVPGDLVLLEPGDRVPADLRLIRARNLRIDEAALTGESVPVDKTVAPVAAEASLGDLDGVFRHLRRERNRNRRGGSDGTAQPARSHQSDGRRSGDAHHAADQADERVGAIP
jgi:magnesium-transporting ATPase (P-type)